MLRVATPVRGALRMRFWPGTLILIPRNPRGRKFEAAVKRGADPCAEIAVSVIRALGVARGKDASNVRFGRLTSSALQRHEVNAAARPPRRNEDFGLVRRRLQPRIVVQGRRTNQRNRGFLTVLGPMLA
jgi:hypothetical protein